MVERRASTRSSLRPGVGEKTAVTTTGNETSGGRWGGNGQGQSGPSTGAGGARSARSSPGWSPVGVTPPASAKAGEVVRLDRRVLLDARMVAPCPAGSTNRLPRDPLPRPGTAPEPMPITSCGPARTAGYGGGASAPTPTGSASTAAS